jgi:hypothetical protein
MKDVREGQWLSRRAALVGLVLAGLALRAYHYARDPAVWHDEAALLVNVLDRSFAELLGPLRWAEAGPPLFLWLERAAFLTLGDSTHALRLPPFLASCASLIVFAWTARRLLPAAGAFWAVLLFAASDRLLWHTCEAKPYAFDVLLAVLLLAAYTATRDRASPMLFLLFALAAPPFIWLSFPVCFLWGGLLLVWLPAVLREPRWSVRLAYAAWSLAVVGSFAALLFGPVCAQRCGDMESCWVRHFPDWSQPWTVPWWTLMSSWEVVRYCFLPLGQVLALLAAIGGLALWRAGRRRDLFALAGPMGLALVAAWLKGYPYGGSRLEVFAAPGLAVLIAGGLLAIRSRARWAAAGALVLTVPGLTLFRAAFPWPRADTAAASRYVMAHRKAGEPIVANHWEYAYYCRAAGADFTLPEEGPPPAGPRLWLIVQEPDVAEKQGTLRRHLLGWRIEEQRDFPAVRVYRLGSDATGSARACPASTTPGGTGGADRAGVPIRGSRSSAPR